jgi:predicted nucleotidyltransferase component of viral defense system
LLGQPGNIKVEIDCYQNVVLPPRVVVYENVWQVDSSIAVMDEVEICAEKIRAVSQRARYRDFYDLYHLANERQLDLIQAAQLLRQKEIRTPIIAGNIARNWEIAKAQKNRDLGTIYCSAAVSDDDIEQLISGIMFEDIR